MQGSDNAHKIAKHIEANACRYYPSLHHSDIQVVLKFEERRPYSSLYRFEVHDDQSRYRIFAKGAPEDKRITPDTNVPVCRARLTPPATGLGRRTRLEYFALKSIEDYFSRLDSTRFGTVRVLDFIPQPQTILMEEHTDPSLRSLFSGSNRLSQFFGKKSDLSGAFFNSGAWLSAFSQIPGSENTTPRLTNRDDFNNSIQKLADFLAKETGDETLFRDLALNVVKLSNEILPTHLPIGLAHGDFAMRNILVCEGDRVTAFDTHAKWLAPIYEDIAYFLVKLETNRMLVMTSGRAVDPGIITAYKSRFLAGYFGETSVPIEAVRLFQIELLLDSWSSQIWIHSRKKKRNRNLYHRLYITQVHRHYRSIMQRLIRDVYRGAGM